jgi:hypothetical protein
MQLVQLACQREKRKVNLVGINASNLLQNQILLCMCHAIVLELHTTTNGTFVFMRTATIGPTNSFTF